MPGDDNAYDQFAWTYHDDVEYNHLKLRYHDRKKLSEEALNKKRAFKDVTPDNPFYHRIAIAAEMAAMRVDMAYILDRNNKLEEQLSTVAHLHQRMDILEGCYSYIKMLVERSRIYYAQITEALEYITKFRGEKANAVEQRNNQPDGAEG